MMDVTMICFSQTGNTRKVAEAMAKVSENFPSIKGFIRTNSKGKI
jgi:flavodoxin